MIEYNEYSNVLLIGEITLKHNTLINENCDGKDLLQPIKYVQDVYLQDIIGTNLLWKIQELIGTKVIDNSTNNNYKVLLVNYIQPYMEAQIISEILPEISFKVRNKGVVTTSDEHVSNSPYSDISKLKQVYEARAVKYGNMLKDFLTRYRAEYPELLRWGIDRTKADLRNAAAGGIYLGDYTHRPDWHNMPNNDPDVKTNK